MLRYSVQPTSVADYHERGFWEYLLKYMYQSADLYIADAKSLLVPEQISVFDTFCNSTGGYIAYSVFDISRCYPPVKQDLFDKQQTWDIERLNFTSNSIEHPFLFPITFAPPPLSSNSGTVHRILIFKILLGKSLQIPKGDTTLSKDPDDFKNIDTLIFSEMSSNILDPVQRLGSIDQQWAKTKYPQAQCIPILACLVDFRPIRVEIALVEYASSTYMFTSADM